MGTDSTRFSVVDKPLKEFPDSIRQRRHLEHLTLVSCGLTKLPKWIGELRQLQTLDLVDNQLTELPAGICRLKSLRNCIWCAIRSVPCPRTWDLCESSAL